MDGEGNGGSSTDVGVSATTYEGDAVVACVDMWDSVGRKGGLGMDGPAGGVGPVLAHKNAVIEQLRQEVDAAGIAAWWVKDLGDGVMVVFPTSPGPPSAPGGLRERKAATEAALRFAVKAVRAAACDGPLQPNSIALSFGPVHLSVDGTHSGAPSLLGYTAVLGVRGYPVDVASRLVAVATENQVLLCTDLRQQLASAAIDIGDGSPVEIGTAAREVRLPASADPLQWQRVTAYQLVEMDEDSFQRGLVGQPEPAPITSRYARLAEQAELAGSLGTLGDGWRCIESVLLKLIKTPEDLSLEDIVGEWKRIDELIEKTRAAVVFVHRSEELIETDIEGTMLEVQEKVEALDGLMPARRGYAAARDLGEEKIVPTAKATAKIAGDIVARLRDARDACQEAIAKGESRVAPLPFAGSSR